MSPLVRVAARPADPRVAAVPVRHRLGLAELVAAARLAGEVPLPVRIPGADPAHVDRMTERLAGTPSSAARARIDAAVRRASDPGPDGALASLADRGLVDGEALDRTVDVGLRALAGAPLAAALDVTVGRPAGQLRLRSWFGVGPGLSSQLSTADGLDYELACFAPRFWTSQLTRAVRVEPWLPEPAPMRLPDHVSLPSELLAGSEKAHREHRTDLLLPMAAAHLGRVRMGERRRVREADAGEILALLRTLGGACRGRLRLLTMRRDREPEPAVTAWLLLDDGWHELRPGKAATSVLRRRDPQDLGLFTQPVVDAVTEVHQDG